MHTRGDRGGGTFKGLPSKNFKTIGQKHAIKNENRVPLDFLTNPRTHSPKELENDRASIVGLNNKNIILSFNL
jgi:hypothetical protein